MSLIVEFSVAADEFLLEESLRAAPEIVVEIERVVANADGRVTPYIWVTDDGKGAFDASIRDDPSVEHVERVDVLDDGALYRAEWRDRGNDLVGAYRTIDMAFLTATGRRARWWMRVRFDDRDEFDAFNDYRRDHDLWVSVERIYHPDEPKSGGRFGLTPTQQETLSVALEAGYYGVPREVTHGELANRLGVSQQAVSDRLHRAHGNLVRSALTIGGEEASPTAGRG